MPETRRLSAAPTWRPMWIMWFIGLPLMLLIDLSLHTYWGTLCLLPYAALWVQALIWRYAGRRDDA